MAASLLSNPSQGQREPSANAFGKNPMAFVRYCPPSLHFAFRSPFGPLWVSVWGGRFRGSRRLPNWLRRGIRYGVGNDTPQRAQIDLRSLPRALQLGLQIGSKRSPKAARKGSGTRTAGLAKMYKDSWLRTLAICPGALFRTALATRMRSGAPRDLPGTYPPPGTGPRHPRNAFRDPFGPPPAGTSRD